MTAAELDALESERRCSACGEHRPLFAFARNNKVYGGGRDYECKACANSRRRVRYQEKNK